MPPASRSAPSRLGCLRDDELVAAAAQVDAVLACAGRASSPAAAARGSGAAPRARPRARSRARATRSAPARAGPPRPRAAGARCGSTSAAGRAGRAPGRRRAPARGGRGTGRRRAGSGAAGQRRFPYTRRLRGAASASSSESVRAPRSCASPIRCDEHLGRRLGVGQRAVARARRDAEEVRERGEADARAGGPRAGGARGRPCRAAARTGGGRSACSCSFEEALVEAGVVGDEQLVARESEEAADDASRPTARVAAPVREDRSAARPARAADARIDERLERVDQLEPLHAHGADLADPVATRPRARSSRGRRRRTPPPRAAGPGGLRRARRSCPCRRRGCRPP